MYTTYFYTLTDPRENEIRYVGKTINPSSRKSLHFTGKGKTHCANWIKNLLEDGLVPIMEIIDEITTDVHEEWMEKERYWIKLHRDMGCPLTNLADGGAGTPGIKHTEEYKAMMSSLRSGVPLSETTKERIRKSQLGRKHSEQSRKNMGDSHRGHKQTPEHIEKVRQIHLGSKRSPEACENIRRSLLGKAAPWATEAARLVNTGRKHTEEHKAKVRAKTTGKKRTPEQTERIRAAVAERTRKYWAKKNGQLDNQLPLPQSLAIPILDTEAS